MLVGGGVGTPQADIGGEVTFSPKSMSQATNQLWWRREKKVGGWRLPDKVINIIYCY